MGALSAFRRKNPQPLESIFRQEKTRVIVRMLAVSGIVIFSIESLLMLSLEFLFTLPPVTILVLDGFFLVVFLFPLNYYFVVRPMMHQIDQHERTNQELEKSYEVVERFFSIKDLLIAYLDPQFNFIRVNQAYADTDERDAAYFPGKNHFELFPNEENYGIFSAVVNTGQAYIIHEKPFEYANNPERGISYWDWSLLPIKDSYGQVIALLLVLSNVTSLKLTQLALAKTEQRFRAIFDQTFQHICLLDRDGKILVANQTLLDFTGLTRENVADQLLGDVPWWVERDQCAGQLQAAVEKAAAGEVTRCESRVMSLTGEPANMDITIKPWIDERGRTPVLIYEARDITERTRAEEALKRSDDEVKRLYQIEIRARWLSEMLRKAAMDMSGSLDSGTVLETLLNHLYNAIPYSSAHIGLLDDENHMVVRFARGEEQWQAEDSLLGKRFDIGTLPFLQPLWQECEMVMIPDTAEHAASPFLPRPLVARSWLGIPLLAGSQVIGVCTLEHTSGDFFTPDLLNWANTLTSQAAIAIQNAWLFEQVRDGRERLQALSRRLVEVQENERHYIAQELHDEAGQALTSLMVGLHLVERDSADQASVIARCQELKQIADCVLEDLHRLAINLRPASLDHLGLVPALRQHTETISDQHNLPIQFQTIGKIERLPGEVETAIYRIVQEALTNVVRHAHASRVDLLLERRTNSLVVMVEDNGVGFDPAGPYIGQLGMIGMRERADMLGGKLVIESAPGKGASIFLEVPWQSES